MTKMNKEIAINQLVIVNSDFMMMDNLMGDFDEEYADNECLHYCPHNVYGKVLAVDDWSSTLDYTVHIVYICPCCNRSHDCIAVFEGEELTPVYRFNSVGEGVTII